jgi:hypothetical protein
MEAISCEQNIEQAFEGITRDGWLKVQVVPERT